MGREAVWGGQALDIVATQPFGEAQYPPQAHAYTHVHTHFVIRPLTQLSHAKLHALLHVAKFDSGLSGGLLIKPVGIGEVPNDDEPGAHAPLEGPGAPNRRWCFPSGR